MRSLAWKETENRAARERKELSVKYLGKGRAIIWASRK